MNRLKSPALAVLLLLACATAAGAGEDPVSGLAARLGSPARAGAVFEALEKAAGANDAAVTLAKALAAARGTEAARGLRTLMAHRDEAVRIEALLSTARLGLRSDDLAEAVNEILVDTHRSARERWAAVSALGAVGDGRDVDALLAITANKEEPKDTRAAAFRALGAITRARIPYVHARWSYWWRKKQARAADRIAKAVAALEDAPRGPTATTEEAALASYGWVDIVGVRQALKRWLEGSRPHLVPVACRLAAYLRLADLEPSLRAAGRGLVTDEARAALTKAMGALGVVVVEGSR